MPTQEWTVSGFPEADAGLMGALLLALHRCSMGLGAGMWRSSIALRSSSMNCMSAPLGRLHSTKDMIKPGSAVLDCTRKGSRRRFIPPLSTNPENGTRPKS